MRCVFSGSFDPVTKGHINIIKRASAMFDEVIVAVANNAVKQSMDISTRITMVEKCIVDLQNVSVRECNGLFADFCIENGVDCIIRGVRSIKDLEYEKDMAFINRDLCGVETLFLSAENALSYVSSGYVRELAMLGRSVMLYVPEEIAEEVQSLYGRKTEKEDV